MPRLSMWKKHFLVTALVAGLAVPVVASLLNSPLLRAQASAPSSTVPQWQIDAGGTAKFDVASVKQDKSTADNNSNVSINNGAGFAPTGGLFSATNFEVIRYFMFAYKVGGSQLRYEMSGLPAWADFNGDKFDVEARAQGNPTKDQYRLMMQALLADRFKLVLHHEIRQGPVYALTLLKPGKTGPQLQAHPADQPCSTAFTPGHGLTRTGPGPSAPSPPSATSGLQIFEPVPCGIANLGFPASTSGRVRTGGRGLTMPEIAAALGGDALIDRPVIDRTGLEGTFDYSLEWSQELHFPVRRRPISIRTPTAPHCARRCKSNWASRSKLKRVQLM